MITRNTTYLISKGRHISLPKAALLVFVFTVLFIKPASAQVHNASDWHVPPPLAPGNTTKGSSGGKQAAGGLVISDVPAPKLPVASPVRLSALAPVAVLSPAVTTPDQPNSSAVVVTGLPAIPLPGAPDAPALPNQTVVDDAANTGDIPFPSAPEMPPVPAEPKSTGSAIATGQKGLPLLPTMLDGPTPALPAGKNPVSWPIPAIIESESLKAGPPGKQK